MRFFIFKNKTNRIKFGPKYCKIKGIVNISASRILRLTGYYQKLIDHNLLHQWFLLLNCIVHFPK